MLRRSDELRPYSSMSRLSNRDDIAFAPRRRENVDDEDERIPDTNERQAENRFK